MATTLFMVRGLGGLRPANKASQEAFDGLPMAETVKVEITRPRNIRHHRKWFALLQVIYPHQTTYPTMESLLAAIKCALGYGETVKLPDGRTVLVPGSISFAKLDQAGFDQFYARALELIHTRILPGIDRDDVEREVAEVLAGRDPA